MTYFISVIIRDENSNLYSYTLPWDSEKVFGCKCDEHFQGYSCAERVCPSGDDPLTTGQVWIKIQ